VKILITGGAGFIGSHLCERLVVNNNIYSLDNYSTGVESNHVLGVKYIRGHTKDIDELVDFIPDIVYHLGEYSRVEQSFVDIEKVWKFNKDGTFAVLQFCVKTKAKLIYAGSSTKFADKGCGADQSPYAWSKATNTQLVKNYGNWFGLKYAITYFYNVYGEREIALGEYATLIALFKNKTKNGQALTVVSPGSQKRNFTHVNDIINGLVLVGEKGKGDGYEIGCEEAYSVLDIAKRFGGRIEMIPERVGNRMSGEIITEKIRKLGWSSTKSVMDYIDNCKIIDGDK